MQRVLHVSRGATQKIVEDLHNLLSFSNIQTLNSVKEILRKHKIKVNSSVLQEISNSIVQTNPLLLTTSNKGSLSIQITGGKYISKKTFLLLNLQNISTTQPMKSITKLLETLRADFLDKVVLYKEGLSRRFNYFQDGNYYK